MALVSDGAEWIQGFGDYHCPDAVRILDFPHAAGYMGEIGRGLFGEASSMAAEWQREQRRRLKHEGAGPVLEDIRVLVQNLETDLSKPLAYLEKREAQMRYPVWRDQGWPIGSGAVESGNKLVVGSEVEGGRNALGAAPCKFYAGLAQHSMQQPLGRGMAAYSPAAQKAGGPECRYTRRESRFPAADGGSRRIRGQTQPSG